MLYSDFTLDKAVDRLGIQIIEQPALWSAVREVIPSPFLQIFFDSPSPFNLNSEMARREMLIAPILRAVFGQEAGRFAVFSAESFNVDAELSLVGLADYLICIAPTKLLIQAPVIAVAESKRNDPVDGLGQCLAELFAVALFNERKNRPLPRLFGMTTNGFEWIFGTYEVESRTFYHDSERYALRDLPRILGILSYMRDEALKMDAHHSS